MRLQSEHAVHHLGAGLLQPFSPVDVRLLVEAREQLDDHRDFLAALRRLDQRFHQHRIHSGAIDGLLDRDHVRIVDRLADELDHRLERSGTDGAAGRRAGAITARRSGLIPQPVGNAWNEERVLVLVEVGLVDHRRHAREVDRAVAAVQIVFLQLELLQQQLGEMRGAAAPRLRGAPRGRTAAAASSPSSAWRRFLTSSSSNHRSASRVTRNCE